MRILNNRWQYGWFACWLALSASAHAEALKTAVVGTHSAGSVYTAEGVVEAVKSSVIAPQVDGSITDLTVKAGDSVKAGQLLVRIDTRMATQQTATNQAQVAAAQAQLSAARKEYERKRRLYEKEYISQAALERAESDFKTAEAEAKAQVAQTSVSRVQTGLHTLAAPYAGVVAEVMAEVGDMAMPGKPLLSLYQPTEMRVVVSVPQTLLANIRRDAPVVIQIPALAQDITVRQMTVLPTADPVSNQVKLRLTLPASTNVSPGMFARAVLALNAAQKTTSLTIPASAVIKRSELTAVYVMDTQGKARLRQIRVGRKQGESVEVFAGLNAGEKVVLNPMAVVSK